MLKIGNFVFEDDWKRRRSSLMYFKGDKEEAPSWSVSIGFAAGDFNCEEISPSLCINPIDTKKRSSRRFSRRSFFSDDNR